MATKVPGDGLADTQMNERAMPPALAAAIAKKAKSKGAPDQRAAGPRRGGGVIALPGDEAERAMPGCDPGMTNDDDADDSENTRKLPPAVKNDIAELNEYPDYSAAADAGNIGPWAKTPDQNSGMLPEGAFQRTARFPDTGVWKQV